MQNILSEYQLVDFLVTSCSDKDFVRELRSVWFENKPVSKEMIFGANKLLSYYTEEEQILMKYRAMGKTLREIGRLKGVSHERIRQLFTIYSGRIEKYEEGRLLLTKGVIETKSIVDKRMSAITEDSSVDKELLCVPISRLGVSDRTCNVLYKNGYRCVNDIIWMKRKEIEGIPRLRDRGIEDVCKALWRNGINARAWHTKTVEMPKSVTEYIHNHPEKTPLECLDLSGRAYRALNEAGLLCAADLIRMSSKEIHNVKNFGRESAHEVYRELKRLGLPAPFWNVY